MCKVKGCRRPHFVGGMCGFHALQGYYRSAPPRSWRRPGQRAPRHPQVERPLSAPVGG